MNVCYAVRLLNRYSRLAEKKNLQAKIRSRVSPFELNQTQTAVERNVLTTMHTKFKLGPPFSRSYVHFNFKFIQSEPVRFPSKFVYGHTVPSSLRMSENLSSVRHILTLALVGGRMDLPRFFANNSRQTRRSAAKLTVPSR